MTCGSGRSASAADGPKGSRSSTEVIAIVSMAAVRNTAADANSQDPSLYFDIDGLTGLTIRGPITESRAQSAVRPRHAAAARDLTVDRDTPPNQVRGDDDGEGTTWGAARYAAGCARLWRSAARRRQASPKASNRLQAKGTSAQRNSGCHCTPTTKLLPGSVTPSI